ncbi:sensor histidine kinase KdpD [Massilia sp. KIM]|uniref:sensor histidine kinase n=1 Tax=Massilia sp. KIM TaxID=1955422 RepID=UPI001E38514A|nr:HAMP domain-containing sensor histidine kinase [Massilia sp. KIM]
MNRKPQDPTVELAEAAAAPGAGIPAAQFRTMAELGGDVAFSIALPSFTLRYLSPAFVGRLGHPPTVLQQALNAPAAGAPLAMLAACLREAASRAPGERTARELEVADAQGRPLPLEVLATVVDEGPSNVALVGLLRDRSAQRAHLAEQKRVASMLNHEFRTPLATIDGAIQRLEATAVGADDATRQRYRKIAGAVDRLIGMLDDYLSPDRMAAIGKTRQASTLTLGELVEGGAARVRAAGREAEVEVAGAALRLRGEPAGLRLALQVLVDNALAFSPPGTPVSLNARPGGGGVEIAVRDRGAGVPAQDAARIFDKGYRGSNAAGLPGSGLGLYMARSILDVHGGSLHLAPIGEGAEFRLWLPAGDGLGQQQLASDRPSSDNRSGVSDSNAGQDTNNMANP